MGEGAIMAQRHPRRGAGGAGSGGAVETRPGSAGAVEKKNLTSGAHVSARGERKGADDGRRESKKKTYFCKYANDACGLAGWAEWAGGLGPGRVGPVDRPRPGKGSRAKSEEERFLN
jgi:hypothetical protein